MKINIIKMLFITHLLTNFTLGVKLFAQSINHPEDLKISLDPYRLEHPVNWGEGFEGIKRYLNTSEKVMALTFDACGAGDSYDSELIEFLRQEKIPATLFLNKRWIKRYPKTTKILMSDPLFDIQNHGDEHRPLSVNGNSIYGIKGTLNIDHAFREVFSNVELIFSLENKVSRYFRAGTAYYDEVSVQMVNDMGLEVVGYSLLGDAGATFTAKQVYNQMMKLAHPGAITLYHMNKPAAGTFEGLKMALPLLKAKGYEFVLIRDYELVNKKPY